jgi:hypothetical protein
VLLPSVLKELESKNFRIVFIDVDMNTGAADELKNVPACILVDDQKETHVPIKEMSGPNDLIQFCDEWLVKTKENFKLVELDNSKMQHGLVPGFRVFKETDPKIQKEMNALDCLSAPPSGAPVKKKTPQRVRYESEDNAPPVLVHNARYYDFGKSENVQKHAIAIENANELEEFFPVFTPPQPNSCDPQTGINNVAWNYSGWDIRNRATNWGKGLKKSAKMQNGIAANEGLLRTDEAIYTRYLPVRLDYNTDS